MHHHQLLFIIDFKPYWEGINLKCMGCTCNAVLRLHSAPGSSGPWGQWEVTERKETAPESPWPAVDQKDPVTEVLFSYGFSGAAVCMSRVVGRSQPQCLCTFQGMSRADLTGSTHLSRPECLCSLARWVVQGLRKSSLKSMRAFPLISKTLD